jgi:SHS2 domain-containing protein
MSYQYLDDFAIADVAFRAEGKSLAELFQEAGDATMNTMVENLGEIRVKTRKRCTLFCRSIEMLLFDLLQELIFYKDAEQLLLRVKNPTVEKTCGGFMLHCTLSGERIDSGRHTLIVDVKAVTLSHFSVEETAGGYRATVVLDV